MNAEQQTKQWCEIVALAWQDDVFKQRLIANPAAVLKEHGLEVPAGIQVKIVEDSEKVVHLTLPARSTADELSDADLENVAGGMCPSAPPASTTQTQTSSTRTTPNTSFGSMVRTGSQQ